MLAAVVDVATLSVNILQNICTTNKRQQLMPRILFLQLRFCVGSRRLKVNAANWKGKSRGERRKLHPRKSVKFAHDTKSKT